VLAVVSSTTAPPVEPPPQAASSNKLKNHVDMANRVDGLQMRGLKFSMGISFQDVGTTL
jgi:hypothetical protein